MMLLRLICLALFWVAGCATSEVDLAPINKTLTVAAGPNINSYNGGANPVVLRIYQLSSRSEFDAADFWTVFNNVASDLAGAVVDQRSLSPIYPDENRLVAIDLEKDTNFLGVFAEFSDYGTQAYLASVPVSEDIMNEGLTITVTASGVAIKDRMTIVAEADGGEAPKEGMFGKLMSMVGLGGA